MSSWAVGVDRADDNASEGEQEVGVAYEQLVSSNRLADNL